MKQAKQPKRSLTDSDAAKKSGRLLALDLGSRRIGVALSDELRITTRPLNVIQRKSWKELLRQVKSLIEEWRAEGLVIGLPLSLDGVERSAAEAVRMTAEKFRLSLAVPVYLQDERLTSFEAGTSQAGQGNGSALDSEAAAIILRDFIETHRND